MTTDAIYRYGFVFYKKDITYSTDALNNTQDDGSLNCIRFAVINRTDNRAVMQDVSTNKTTSNDL